MKTDEIRSAFLRYFAEREHTIVPSSSLVPAGDPTLLFVNSGMVQFKDCFLGLDKRPYLRATTSQKCLRISGKHNDLENVGRTARHHTFFEMLGNFSFGDYFKEDAIKFAWGFLTETLQLKKNRLWVTVFEDDDDAATLWSKHTDVFSGRILRCGKEDNFWAMGETGPCGPCSEIHYYLGQNTAGQSETEFRKGDGTYIEIWNLVFMQFNRDLSGVLTPLPKPSVDTGLGLERIAAVKQEVLSNYDTDLLRRLIAVSERLSGKKYDGSDYRERNPEKDQQYAIDVAMRVIADHARAAAFLIADGINPSSDGRGYVLRRLIRRACKHARILAAQEAFLHRVAAEVIETMSVSYPELETHRQKIEKILLAEEEKFLETLDTGLAILNKEVTALKQSSIRTVPGKTAFLLHDTYGFPVDLTEDIVRSQGIAVDLEGFAFEMEKQRERARHARASETELVLLRVIKPIATKFVGYEFFEYESTVLGIFSTSGELPSAKLGEEVAIVSAETPFYGEAGGQVGDTGTMSSNNASLDVIDTQKVGDTIVHIGRVTEGDITSGASIRLSIASARRKKIRANHSSTHLLHMGLREVLGDHIRQAGSRVGDEDFRFDFTHFEPISQKQLEEIEYVSNQIVQENHQTHTEILPIDEAKKSGAIALFGEKYGETVRVVQIGPRSRELCGGTHVQRSGDIGVLTIVAEESVSAGVRRIVAKSGAGALTYISAQKKLLKEMSNLLKTGERDLGERVARLLEQNRALEREREKLLQKTTFARGGDLLEKVVTSSNGIKIIASVIEQATPKQLREVADDVKERLGVGCIIALGSISEGKVILLTAVTEDLTGKYHAGKLLDEMSKVIGGRGGGRADLAQAGGGDPSKLTRALEHFQELVS